MWEGIPFPPVRARKVAFCLVLFHHPPRHGKRIHSSWGRLGVLPCAPYGFPTLQNKVSITNEKSMRPWVFS